MHGKSVHLVQKNVKMLSNFQCLIYNEIPFAEDVRQFTFGSLPVKEENTAANKKFVPSGIRMSNIHMRLIVVNYTFSPQKNLVNVETVEMFPG